MSLLDDIETQLSTDSVGGGATGWNIYKSYLPPTPDKAIVIYETGGLTPDQTQVVTHDFPTFQIAVRGEEFGYEAARAKIQAVFESVNNATIAGYTYIYASDSGPIPLGYDKDENRPTIVWNFSAMKTRV